MGDTPAVSVCVPLYQKERYVGETIRGILDQSFTDFELVVLDNASTDRSARIVAEFDDPRIQLRHNETTVPMAENFARVIGMSRAPLVKLVAADDRLHPRALEVLVAAMADPDVVVASSRHNVIDEHGDVIYADRTLRHPDLIGRQRFETVLRRVVRHSGNPLGGMSNALFRRSAYDAAGGMADAPAIALDLATWLAMLEHGHFYGVDATLCDFRLAGGTASAHRGNTGSDDQIRFVDGLVARHRELVRTGDRMHRALRTPLIRARIFMIVAAAGPQDSVAAGLARRALSLSRPARRVPATTRNG